METNGEKRYFDVFYNFEEHQNGAIMSNPSFAHRCTSNVFMSSPKMEWHGAHVLGYPKVRWFTTSTNMNWSYKPNINLDNINLDKQIPTWDPNVRCRKNCGQFQAVHPHLFPKIGVPPVIIHFRWRFSMKWTIQILGYLPFDGTPQMGYFFKHYKIILTITLIIINHIKTIY